jgi:hypothetical protein
LQGRRKGARPGKETWIRLPLAELTAALSLDEQRAEPLIRPVFGALQDVPVARQELAPPGAGSDL